MTTKATPVASMLVQDGCWFHRILPESVTERWEAVERAGAECAWCPCCHGPCRVDAELCSKCEDINAGAYSLLMHGMEARP